MFGKNNNDQEETKQEPIVDKLESVYKKTIYKVSVTRVDVYDVPQTDYKGIGKEEDGSAKYAYVQNGKYEEEEKNEVSVYSQKFSENELDVRELALWANRVK